MNCHELGCQNEAAIRDQIEDSLLNDMNEEAMFCSICGKEDEGVDADDVCMACGGIEDDPR